MFHWYPSVSDVIFRMKMSIFLSRAQLCAGAQVCADTSGGYQTKPELIHEGAKVQRCHLTAKNDNIQSHFQPAFVEPVFSLLASDALLSSY